MRSRSGATATSGNDVSGRKTPELFDGYLRDRTLAIRFVAGADAVTLPTEALAELDALLTEAAAGPDPEPTASEPSARSTRAAVRIRASCCSRAPVPTVCASSPITRARKGGDRREFTRGAVPALETSAEGVQVRVEGTVEQVSDADSDAYFATRPRGSQIGAWASLQSQVLAARTDFEQRIAQFEAQFEDGDVPRPPDWGGYLVKPDLIEFWYGAKFRLHERLCYQRIEGTWRVQQLYP